MKKLIILTLTALLSLITACGNSEEQSSSTAQNQALESSTQTQSESGKDTESTKETMSQQESSSVEETTQKPTETAKETEKPTVKPTQAPTQPTASVEMTKEQALRIANEAIRRYEDLDNMGMCCDNESSSDNITAYMTNDQMGWASGQVKCLCCKTVNEAKAHMLKYVDASFVNKFAENAAVVGGGNLYFIQGAVGYIKYDRTSIKILAFDNSQIVAECDVLNSGGIKDSVSRFTLKKVNSSYVIVSVEDRY